MNDTGKKVGYLKGLLEGMQSDADSPNSKLLAGIVELLGDLSDRADAVDELLDDLNDYVESIDDDLSAMEGEDSDFDFLDDDDDDGDFDDDDDGFDAEDHLHLFHPDAGHGGKRTVALCAKCGKPFGIEDGWETDYICPHCGQRTAPSPITPQNAPDAEPVED